VTTAIIFSKPDKTEKKNFLRDEWGRGGGAKQHIETNGTEILTMQ